METNRNNLIYILLLLCLSVVITTSSISNSFTDVTPNNKLVNCKGYRTWNPVTAKSIFGYILYTYVIHKGTLYKSRNFGKNSQEPGPLCETEKDCSAKNIYWRYVGKCKIPKKKNSKKSLTPVKHNRRLQKHHNNAHNKNFTIVINHKTVNKTHPHRHHRHHRHHNHNKSHPHKHHRQNKNKTHGHNKHNKTHTHKHRSSCSWTKKCLLEKCHHVFECCRRVKKCAKGKCKYVRKCKVQFVPKLKPSKSKFKPYCKTITDCGKDGKICRKVHKCCIWEKLCKNGKCVKHLNCSEKHHRSILKEHVKIVRCKKISRWISKKWYNPKDYVRRRGFLWRSITRNYHIHPEKTESVGAWEKIGKCRRH